MKITIVTKLKIRHSKYNDWSRGVAKQTNKQTNKQTQRQKNWPIFRQKNLLKKQKDILTNRRTSRLTVDKCTERVKQIMKNELPYVLFFMEIINNK